MSRSVRRLRTLTLTAGAVLAAAGVGCQMSPKQRASQAAQAVPDFEVPKELTMTAHPPYTVSAPDILRIDANRLIPLPPYKIEPLDALYLFAEGAPEQNPVNGIYPVDPDGTINLGPKYGGQLRVADLTSQDAEKVIASVKKFKA